MVCTKLLVHIMSEQGTQAKGHRREHSAILKRELIERSLRPGASVSAIALENGINANLLFKWRREHLRAIERPPPMAPRDPQAMLLPVKIETCVPEVAATPTLPSSRPSPGTIEIDIGGARIRLRGAIDESSVRIILQTLRALA
jgi:transposase